MYHVMTTSIKHSNHFRRAEIFVGAENEWQWHDRKMLKTKDEHQSYSTNLAIAAKVAVVTTTTNTTAVAVAATTMYEMCAFYSNLNDSVKRALGATDATIFLLSVCVRIQSTTSHMTSLVCVYFANTVTLVVDYIAIFVHAHSHSLSHTHARIPTYTQTFKTAWFSLLHQAV